MISFLRDSPLLAIRPHLGQTEKPDFLVEYPKFINYLKTNFRDPDEKSSARQGLCALRQTASASPYFAEFNQYIAILGWKDQEPIVDKAVEGLSSSIKDELARARRNFDNLSELINFVIPLDNRLYEKELERKREEKEKPTRT